MGWFTKIKILYVTTLFVVLYFVSYFNSVIGLPLVYKKLCCADDKTLNLFLISLPIFIFSVASLKLKDKAFVFWRSFTFIFILFYIFLYFIAPTKGDGFIWIQREAVSFFLTILYTLVSLILIIYKSLRTRV